MHPADLPNPMGGFVLTHFLVVSDQDRSRDYYQSVFDGKVVRDRDPVIAVWDDLVRVSGSGWQEITMPSQRCLS